MAGYRRWGGTAKSVSGALVVRLICRRSGGLGQSPEDLAFMAGNWLPSRRLNLARCRQNLAHTLTGS